MKFVDYVAPEKQDCIWENTKTYPTKGSSITTLYDLLVGLDKSGYPNWANFLYEGPKFTVIKRDDLLNALKNILFISGDVIYSLADLDSHYGAGALGYSSFATLESGDLISNPRLLKVLLGALFHDYDLSRTTGFGSGFVLDYDKHHGRKYSCGYDECIGISRSIADRLIEKSKKKSSAESEFGWWGRTNAGLDLTRSGDYLYASEKPLYHIGCIGYCELRLKELEGRKPHKQLDATIAGYKKTISDGSDCYYPYFSWRDV